ncbi:rhodanese-like domain-containing protein [Rhodococcus opacus]|uniref:rhodanese-like domain-containing protein n=1 Tax=Rhodococcus opacus TaxID=37919 RepID=UPI00295367B6|nr:rhodanese-like domain-containing protein [Rhodococcus opacus]MDV7084088.1 rhodanese-like domain-containing protein [Rhodococcus opacus]
MPGAQLLPLGQLGDRVTEIPAGAVEYVICASGNRSVQGARILMTAGRPAVSVAGGAPPGGPRRAGSSTPVMAAHVPTADRPAPVSTRLFLSDRQGDRR